MKWTENEVKKYEIKKTTKAIKILREQILMWTKYEMMKAWDEGNNNQSQKNYETKKTWS